MSITEADAYALAGKYTKAIKIYEKRCSYFKSALCWFCQGYVNIQTVIDKTDGPKKTLLNRIVMAYHENSTTMFNAAILEFSTSSRMLYDSWHRQILLRIKSKFVQCVKESPKTIMAQLHAQQACCSTGM
jgi:hypothetical protein